MDQQALEDLLALISLRSVTLAARQRNVSQSAYSRRLQAIEQRNGITLFDRTRRPARPLPALDAMRIDIEAALGTLKRLDARLSTSGSMEGSLSIAAMHSLSMGALPIALKQIAAQLHHRPVRLRSANRDGCFQMLMTGEVSLMVSYETEAMALNAPAHLVRTTRLCVDRLLPVCSPALLPQLRKSGTTFDTVPLLTYPAEVFLGRVLSSELLPQSRRTFRPVLTAGMTSVLLSAAVQGLGMAWLPASVAADAIGSGALVEIGELGFSALDMGVSMLRLRTPDSQALDALYDALGACIASAVEDLRAQST